MSVLLPVYDHCDKNILKPCKSFTLPMILLFFPIGNTFLFAGLKKEILNSQPIKFSLLDEHFLKHDYCHLIQMLCIYQPKAFEHIVEHEVIGNWIRMYNLWNYMEIWKPHWVTQYYPHALLSYELKKWILRIYVVFAHVLLILTELCLCV